MEQEEIREKIRVLEEVEETAELIEVVEDIFSSVENTPSVIDQLEEFSNNIGKIRATLSQISENLEKKLAMTKEAFNYKKSRYSELSKMIAKLEAEYDVLEYIIKNFEETKSAFYDEQKNEDLEFVTKYLDGLIKRKRETITLLRKELIDIEKELYRLSEEIADSILTILVLTPKKDVNNKLTQLGKIILKEIGKEGFERVIKIVLSKMGIALTLAI